MIARNRKNPALRLAASACGKFLRAYDNQFNWDIASNGERFAVSAVTAAAPGVIFDVGANVGTYARACAALRGVTQVHAFEISPPTFALLSRNCAGIANIHLHPFGLSASAATTTIYHAPDSADRTGLLPVDDGYRRQILPAQTRTGDDCMNDLGVRCVTFLKIDVEGTDLDVLKGFSTALSERRIGAVQFEHGEPSIEARTFLRDIIHFLNSFGFHTYRLFPNSLEQIEHCTYAMEDFRGRNYIALLPQIAATLNL